MRGEVLHGPRLIAGLIGTALAGGIVASLAYALPVSDETSWGTSGFEATGAIHARSPFTSSTATASITPEVTATQAVTLTPTVTTTPAVTATQVVTFTPTATPPLTATAVATISPQGGRVHLPFAANRYTLRAVPSRPTATRPPATQAPPEPTATVDPSERHGYECRFNRNLTFCSWLSSGSPRAGDPITGFGQLLADGEPLAGVAMRIQWSFPYPTVRLDCEATSGPEGIAACSVVVPTHAAGRSGSGFILMNHAGLTNQRSIAFTIR